jgi:hypothetical protein
MDIAKIAELQKVLKDYGESVRRNKAMTSVIENITEELRSMASHLHTLARRVEGVNLMPDTYQARLCDALIVVRKKKLLKADEFAKEIGVSVPMLNYFRTHAVAEVPHRKTKTTRLVEEYLVKEGYSLAELQRG